MELIRGNENHIFGFKCDGETVIFGDVDYASLSQGDDLWFTAGKYGKNFVFNKWHNNVVLWNEDKFKHFEFYGSVKDAITNGYVEGNDYGITKGAYGEAFYMGKEDCPIHKELIGKDFFLLLKTMRELNLEVVGNVFRYETCLRIRIKKYDGKYEGRNHNIGFFANAGKKYIDKGLDLPPYIFNKTAHYCYQSLDFEFLTIFGGIFRGTYTAEKGREIVYEKTKAFIEAEGWKNMTEKEIVDILEKCGGAKEIIEDPDVTLESLAKRLPNIDTADIGDSWAAVIGAIIAVKFFKFQ